MKSNVHGPLSLVCVKDGAIRVLFVLRTARSLFKPLKKGIQFKIGALYVNRVFAGVFDSKD